MILVVLGHFFVLLGRIDILFFSYKVFRVNLMREKGVHYIFCTYIDILVRAELQFFKYIDPSAFFKILFYCAVARTHSLIVNVRYYVEP